MSIANAYAGQICVVTGCHSGMGEATARALAAAGAEVIGLDVADGGPDGVEMRRIDMGDPKSIDDAIAGLPGEVDAVFSCAGLPTTHSPEAVMAVNFFGTRHFVEGVHPRLRPGGGIAVIASAGGLAWSQSFDEIRPLLDAGSFAEGLERFNEIGDVGDHYVFSKQCVTAYVVLNAPRFIAAGVRLNALSPGVTATPMMREFDRAYADVQMPPIPIGRQSSPDEQAYGLLFLNHPDSTYVVGANLENDGGLGSLVLAAMVADQPGAPA